LVADHPLAFSIKNGTLFAMSVTITLGKSGRLVVPKAIRDSLGLREGSRLKLAIQGGKLEAEPEADEMDIDLSSGFPVIRAKSTRKGLSAVEAIKADREARADRLAPAYREVEK
jgi:AbrB family looped-hinge helix DNA binding protein